MLDRPPTFFRTLQAALRYFRDHGFQSEAEVERWANVIQAAQEREGEPDDVVEARLRRYLGSLFAAAIGRFRKAFDRRQRKFYGLPLGPATYVGRQGPEQYFGRLASWPEIETRVRDELDRRIFASRDLIKLNKDKARRLTLQRFMGFVTSLPPHGTPAADLPNVRDIVAPESRNERFIWNRMFVDQGHKFNAAANFAYADATGALAMIWRANGPHQANYDGRHWHSARDGKIYLMRGSWAHVQGLVKPNDAGYYDAIVAPPGASQPKPGEADQPGVGIYCRCTAQYIYNLDALPYDMLTAKGKAALNNA